MMGQVESVAVQRVCNNCAWIDIFTSRRNGSTFYCNNENSPRGDEPVEQSDSCDAHEFEDEAAAR